MLWIALGSGEGGMERAMNRIARHFDAHPRIHIVPNHLGWLGRARTVFRIRRLIPSGSDEIHLFGGTTISLGTLAMIGRGTPVVAWVRNSLKDTGPGLKRRLLKWSLQKAVRVSVNSERIKGEVRELAGPEVDIKMLPNWSPNIVLDATQLRKPSASAPILWCSRLAPAKRPADVLHAFSRCRTTRPLVLLGGGPYLSQLQKLARELNITARTHFVGHVEDPSDWYRSAFAFVFSSDFDATANSLLEALAAGLPIVAFAGQGADEVLDAGRYGLYHQRGDFEGFARSLEQLEAEEIHRQWSRISRDRAKDFALSTLEPEYARFIHFRWPQETSR